MTITIKRVVGIAVAAAALLVPASALATTGPVQAPAIPGVAGLPGPLVDPGKPAATMSTLKASPDIAVAEHEDDDLRRRASGEQGRHPHVEHRERRLDARRTPRQRRLPRPQDDEVPRPAGQGAHRRNRCLQRHDRRSARLGRPARHLRRRRRPPGREGRLPDRPSRDDDAEEGPDRHADHDHVLRPRFFALRGLGGAQLRQQVLGPVDRETGRAGSPSGTSVPPAPSASTSSTSTTPSPSAT